MDKLEIAGLEGAANGVVVEAQFNPKEISIDKSVSWTKQKKQGPADLAYTGAEPKTMSCELMFDGFESGSSIQTEIDKLHLLSAVDPALKRPPKVKVVWGTEGTPGMIPRLDAVIESIGITYTMFNGDGVPLRATTKLRFTEARNLKVGKPQ